MAWIGGNYYLSQAEMEGNAREIETYARSHGWTKNATAAILGNMQAESGINPGIWEMLNPYNGGYGLVQWTPYTKYSDWATAQGYSWQNNGPAELDRISYEAANNLQWFYNAEIGANPPCTFEQFLKLNLYDLQTSTNLWLWFYEHPADPGPTTQAIRYGYAQSWYAFMSDWPDIGTLPAWLLFKFKDWRRWN